MGNREREKRERENIRIGTDLDERVRIFPHVRSGFASLASLTRKSYPPAYTSPSISPLFRFRRFNLGFSTQFGALHGGLYARFVLPSTSATYTLFSLSPLPSILTYLPILCAHIHEPPIAGITSSLVSTTLVLILSQAETATHRLSSFFLFVFYFFLLSSSSLCFYPLSLSLSYCLYL